MAKGTIVHWPQCIAVKLMLMLEESVIYDLRFCNLILYLCFDIDTVSWEFIIVFPALVSLAMLLHYQSSGTLVNVNIASILLNLRHDKDMVLRSNRHSSLWHVRFNGQLWILQHTPLHCLFKYHSHHQLCVGT